MRKLIIKDLRVVYTRMTALRNGSRAPSLFLSECHWTLAFCCSKQRWLRIVGFPVALVLLGLFLAQVWPTMVWNWNHEEVHVSWLITFLSTGFWLYVVGAFCEPIFRQGLGWLGKQMVRRY